MAWHKAEFTPPPSQLKRRRMWPFCCGGFMLSVLRTGAPCTYSTVSHPTGSYGELRGAYYQRETAQCAGKHSPSCSCQFRFHSRSADKPPRPTYKQNVSGTGCNRLFPCPLHPISRARVYVLCVHTLTSRLLYCSVFYVLQDA